MIEQSIIHIHIPKTAGSTIDSILAPCFRPEEHFKCGNNTAGLNHFESNVYFANLPQEEQRKYKYISGHVEYFLLQAYPEKHFSFTILRNPLDRIISMYYYIQRTPTHHLYKILQKPGFTIAKFVRGKYWHEIDNGMCRRISGINGQVPYGECPPEVLNLAKYNLENNFSFFGLQERFNESLFLLLYSLQALDRLEYTKANVTPYRKAAREIGDRDKKALLQYNALDMELYRFSRQIYTQRYKQAASILQKPLQNFMNAMSMKNRDRDPRVISPPSAVAG